MKEIELYLKLGYYIKNSGTTLKANIMIQYFSLNVLQLTIFLNVMEVCSL
jgi:hypothetical protein